MMDFRVLGPVELHAEGKPVDIGPPRQRAVLAALSVDVGRPVLPGTMIDRVWGEEPPDGVRHGLHVYVARIRRVLRQADASTGACLVRRSGGYVLDVDPDRVDMHRFAGLVQQSRDPGRTDLDRVTLLRQAMQLWRGTPLADLPGLWVAQVRQNLVRQRLETAVAWAQAEIAVGGAAATIPTLTELVGEHPLVENLVAALMRAHHATGNTEEALGSYTSLRQRLVEALGVEPGAELKSLHRTVLCAGTDQPVAPSLRDSPVPAQLPMDVPGFTGRSAELRQLNGLLTPAQPTGVVVSVVSGTAGVGKTALAVHWAHRVRSSFPDGQLCVDLRGFAPDGFGSAGPDEVIRGFLEALGVAPHRVPATLADRAALYRSMLTGRRMLVLLDNARDAQQVRPLLPGSPGCLVLVTSRHQLPGLVAAHGARPLVLDLPSPDEAREMMTRRLGATDRGTLDEIIALCARLPLALSITAARAATRPHIPLQALAAELRGTSGCLAAFVGDDEATDVRAALSWSYRALSPDAAALFRRLSQHPGPEVPVAAAASLGGVSLVRARRLLAELAHAHLVSEQQPGRYAMHGLLRAYAVEQAHRVDVGADRQAALLRMLDSDAETLGFGCETHPPGP
jgi:DNA-binding SARP family transcriptional activator